MDTNSGTDSPRGLLDQFLRLFSDVRMGEVLTAGLGLAVWAGREYGRLVKTGGTPT